MQAASQYASEMKDEMAEAAAEAGTEAGEDDGLGLAAEDELLDEEEVEGEEGAE